MKFQKHRLKYDHITECDCNCSIWCYIILVYEKLTEKLTVWSRIGGWCVCRHICLCIYNIMHVNSVVGCKNAFQKTYLVPCLQVLVKRQIQINRYCWQMLLLMLSFKSTSIVPEVSFYLCSIPNEWALIFSFFMSTVN